MAKKSKVPSNNIAQNKKARFDYHLEDTIEAGVVLQGWEVKSCRAGKVQLTDSYVYFKNGEAFLMGTLIQPLPTVSTHFVADPTRTRKLLLKDKEIAKLQQAVEQKGHSVVATALYWKGHLVKAAIAQAHGKKMHDKRATEKERDWDKEKRRIMKASS